ncbi:MAG: hypothetical protein JWM34_480 [Ilumatobacteraceae bacterium]|nr:hypothetical protein [Ilumatobacteraceae bacterium]
MCLQSVRLRLRPIGVALPPVALGSQRLRDEAAQGQGDFVIDMSAWGIEQVDVCNDLFLDPENVRLDLQVSGTVPEADLMAALFSGAKVLDLVESIVRVGYMTHEIPIALRQRGKLYVVEGNRRTAALKAIQNPYLVPAFQGRVDALAKNLADRAALRNIEVKIAPSRTDANQLIAALHTGTGRVAWSPQRQAEFFDREFARIHSLKKLQALYPTVDVTTHVVRGTFVSLLRSVSYNAPALSDYLSSPRFGTASSALARIYEAKPFIQLTGFGIDTDGKLTLSVSRAAFDEMAHVIVGGLDSGRLDTRSIGTVKSKEFLALMDELQAIADKHDTKAASGSSASGQPAGTTGGQPASSGTADSSGSGTGTASDSDPGKGKKKGSSKSRTLQVDHLVVPPAFPQSVHDMVRELTTLDIEIYPNAALDLLRTLLEKTTKAFADSKNEQIIKKSNQAGFIYLKDCMIWLEGWFSTNGNRACVQAVKALNSTAKSSPIWDWGGSTDFLNAINHNHFVSATPDRVRSAWNGMRNVIGEMLK